MATTAVPINGTDQYSHKLPKKPDNKAGAKDLAGFIDAPDMNEKKKMSDN